MNPYASPNEQTRWRRRIEWSKLPFVVLLASVAAYSAFMLRLSTKSAIDAYPRGDVTFAVGHVLFCLLFAA